MGGSGGRQNLNLLQYVTPARLCGNGLMGFSKRPPFSLHPLHYANLPEDETCAGLQSW